ncbi:MAG TPA: hypothetical protein VIZ18_07290 [Ktedonobacteraceae bacterium]
MNTMAIAISGSLIISLFVTSIFALWYKERFNDYMGKDDKWGFKDWAGPLTAMAASLSLILTLTQSNSAITGISIICGASIILMPTAYQALSPSKGRVWIFLVFTALTLCAVTMQLVVAALMADDKLVNGVPATYVHVFRSLMWAAAVIAHIYYCRSTYQALEKQSYAPSANKSSTSQAQGVDTAPTYSRTLSA